MGDDLTAEQLWSDLADAYRLDAPPKGAKSVAEIAAEWKKSDEHTRVLLRKLVSAGKMAFKECARPEDGKRARYYWPVVQGEE